MADDGARGSRDVRLFPRSAVSRTISRADTPPRNPAALAMQPSVRIARGDRGAPRIDLAGRRHVRDARGMRDACPRGSSTVRPGPAGIMRIASGFSRIRSRFSACARWPDAAPTGGAAPCAAAASSAYRAPARPR
ncbi:hypothetical protein WS71_26435 [Burkholderia mayonis]|uniref:Uncharacterized protein n=1 Tax=Burkholderia mayonis TaxID=1385591 RepID=A0A1B4G469_9BURK|nr:hypothetical protein WS71_26435 [Burkholderia mayonis]KVE53110.1 hypothetical protein WS71_07510 [Burkholderia mayonis]